MACLTCIRRHLQTLTGVLMIISVIKWIYISHWKFSLSSASNKNTLSLKLHRFVDITRSAVEFNCDDLDGITHHNDRARSATPHHNGIVVGISVNAADNLTDIIISLDSFIISKYTRTLHGDVMPFSFVIQVTSVDDHSAAVHVAQSLIQKYANSGENCAITIITPNSSLYSFDGATEHSTSGEFDDVINTHLRTLEWLHLLAYCEGSGAYVMTVNTEFIARSEYRNVLSDVISGTADRISGDADVISGSRGWLELSFSGFPEIGKVYSSKVILRLVDSILQSRHWDQPHEHIAEYVSSVCDKCTTVHCNSRCLHLAELAQIVHKPSLFEPVSTATRDKTQLVRNNYVTTQRRETLRRFDPNIPVRYEYWPFQEIPIYINPVATVTTSVSVNTTCTISSLYSFQCHYATLRPRAGDVIILTFRPPVRLAEFYFRTGHGEIPGSEFPTSVYIDVTPFVNELISRESTDDVRIGKFTRRGISQGPLGGVFGKIQNLKIRFSEDIGRVVALRDMVLRTLGEEVECCEGAWPDPYPRGIPGFDPYH